jgi:hypothetical protein
VERARILIIQGGAPSGAKDMEIITIVTLDALFLILLVLIAMLDRKVGRLKNAYARSLERTERRLHGIMDELGQVRAGVSVVNAEAVSEETTGGEERLRARLAEKRFTEGIASILSYGLDARKTDKEEKQ